MAATSICSPITGAPAVCCPLRSGWDAVPVEAHPRKLVVTPQGLPQGERPGCMQKEAGDEEGFQASWTSGIRTPRGPKEGKRGLGRVGGFPGDNAQSCGGHSTFPVSPGLVPVAAVRSQLRHVPGG